MNDTAVDAASPASFHPRKAQTITGLRRLGRSRHSKSIQMTVSDVRNTGQDPLCDRR